MSKQKSDEKDDHPLKKGLGVSVGDKQSKQLLPPKPSHKVGNGLMMVIGLVT